MNRFTFRTMTMAATAIALMAAGVWVVRDGRFSRWASDQALAFFGQADGGSPAQPGSASPAASVETVRGDVTIDPRRQQLLGVRTVTVERRSVSRTIRTAGVVRSDERRLVDVNVRVDGWIRDLHVNYTGQSVRQGDVLFTLYSPDLAATEQEYLLALKARDEVAESSVADAHEYANRLVESARRRLELWNVDSSEIERMRQQREAQGTVLFRSPASGFVVDKQAVQGMHVQAGQSLYRIADLSVVWVDASVYAPDLPLIRVGQQAMASFEGYPGQHASGRVIYVAPTLDEATRTTQVRFELPNGQGRVKPGMYATITLEFPAQDVITVPPNAVLDSGVQQFVFIAKRDGHFEPRIVKTGFRAADTVQILEGLTEGEDVASSALFLIDSESQLRGALQGFEQQPASSGPSLSAAVDRSAQLGIEFRTNPDPPRAGENTLEVSLTDARGMPVADASVSVTLFMAAMPSMNMPAMRQESALPPVGGGVYRGTAEIMTPGRWEVTVTATRGGRALGSKQLALIAR